MSLHPPLASPKRPQHRGSKQPTLLIFSVLLWLALLVHGAGRLSKLVSIQHKGQPGKKDPTTVQCTPTLVFCLLVFCLRVYDSSLPF